MSKETLADVDAFLSSGLKGSLPASLERAYQVHRQSYRSKALKAGCLPSLLVYNLFLPADYYLMPNTAILAIALHGLISAWIVGMGVVLARHPTRMVRELLAVSGPALMVAQILAIFALNDTQAAGDYQYLAIMIIIYMNVNVRPDFQFALAASGLLLALYVTVVICSDAHLSAKLIGCFSAAAGTYLTLTANWRMEQDSRHTFLRRLQDQLKRATAEAEAGRDALTGLFNRRHLERESERLWKEASSGTAVAAIVCDIDYFKAYNDRYGHPAGDLCLKRAATAIAEELRDERDMAVRIGGEEFLILLPHANAASASRTAERIRRAIVALAVPHEASVQGIVTASFGVMAGPAEFHSLAELIAGADGALYAAKRNGRNQVWPPFGERSEHVVQPAYKAA